MNYATEYIASALRAAREAKGLSQRAVSAKSGVPQGHLSKIENGAVDLRVSSVVALARVLDLELTLVPRKSVPAVKSIVRSSAQSTQRDDVVVSYELARLRDALGHLPEELLLKREWVEARRYLLELQHFRLSRSDIEDIRKATRAVKRFLKNPENLNAARNPLSHLRKLRNVLAHGPGNGNEIGSVRPAYNLDDDDHG